MAAALSLTTLELNFRRVNEREKENDDRKEEVSSLEEVWVYTLCAVWWRAQAPPGRVRETRDRRGRSIHGSIANNRGRGTNGAAAANRQHSHPDMRWRQDEDRSDPRSDSTIF